MANLLLNGDFQSVNWMTRPDRNQVPEHWNLEIVPNGSEMFWPTKGGWDNGQRVTLPAIADRQPEIVHKGFVPTGDGWKWTLPEDPSNPDDETDGGPNSLLIGKDDSGQLPKRCVKFFHGPSNSALWQEVIGLTPGRKVRLTAAVVVKVNDEAHAPDGKLEADHYHLRVALGGGTLAEKHVQFSDQPKVNQPIQWIFELNNTVRQDGTVTVAANPQQNWPDDPDGPSFWFNPFRLEYIDATPAPEPEPTPEPPPTTPELDALRAELVQLRLRVDALTGALNANATGALARLEAMIAHSDVSIANEQSYREALIKARDEVRKLIP